MVSEIMKKLEQVEEEKEKLLATIEQMKTQIVPSTNINNNNTINNNSNNTHITVQQLKIYLNTECKDAQTILNFIENLNISINERCELELVNYPTIVSKIWKRNYLALPINERPLYCVPTAESECTVFAKGEETWQEQNESEFMAKLETKPKGISDTMLATTAIDETCHKIHELYEEERFCDNDVADRLQPKSKGPDRDKWIQRKADIWKEACKLDADQR